MPCAGCKERMSEPKGNYKMKFIGKPGGVFMKGAPGNYEQGKVYNIPFRFSRKAYWDLLEKPPVLVAPEIVEGDNVFDDKFFESDDSASIELMPPISLTDDFNADPDAPATLEAHMTYNKVTGKLRKYEPRQTGEDKSEEVIEEKPVETVSNSEDEFEELTVKVEPTKKSIRDALIKTLEDAGKEIKLRTRTTTLQKMVDKLAPEE